MSERGTRRWRTAAAATACAQLIVFVAAGCGAGDEVDRYPVSGEVTYDGDPVPAGSILFQPDASQGNRGPGTSAQIEDGRYSTREGKGTIGGPHSVRIVGYDGVPVPEEGSPQGTVLFPPYQTAVDLPEGPAEHDFHIDPGGEQNAGQ